MVELSYAYMDTEEELTLFVYDDGSYVLKYRMAVVPLSGRDTKTLIKFLKKARRREIWHSIFG